jgi:hypothetical protein
VLDPFPVGIELTALPELLLLAFRVPTGDCFDVSSPPHGASFLDSAVRRVFRFDQTVFTRTVRRLTAKRSDALLSNPLRLKVKRPRSIRDVKREFKGEEGERVNVQSKDAKSIRFAFQEVKQIRHNV